MPDLLQYKDYYGTVEYSLVDEILHGKVVGINGLLSYEGQTIQELRADFKTVVDEYLATCQQENIPPQKSYRGSFNVRIEPELHQKLAKYANDHGQSLNASVALAIQKMVERS
ncbi:type II toxin-antitoxin system HicB family antitoxin [Lactobacillus sp. AN1001]|uniref:type II toxin-antitoxin system HicB family antitoxin n=1 Tax=Ligilactobacillus animalis TaxID=1605 RepID=UPI00242B9797|nr:type II toxin-antitoxin system HicB family antitoxin [Ligilactobacillus animalis]MCI5941888.1 type II toxin-antitoxin system HicB family antitoxin [Ligilactobacillus animalis]MDY2992524.1 type II toxin-antitoxin system HicB family antitoxin [Ligilactobacillus animalis]